MRAGGDYTDAQDNESYSSPAAQADMLMQPDDRKQDHDHIADGGCRQNIAEVGKRDRGHVAGHANEKENDSENNEGIRDGGQDSDDVIDVDGAGLLHAAREESVSDGTEDHDAEDNEILTNGQASAPVGSGAA